MLHIQLQKRLLEIKRVSEKYNAPISMHVAETDKEFEKFKNLILSWISWFFRIVKWRFIAAHKYICLTDSDIEILKKRDVGIAHNMVANVNLLKVFHQL